MTLNPEPDEHETLVTTVTHPHELLLLLFADELAPELDDGELALLLPLDDELFEELEEELVDDELDEDDKLDEEEDDDELEELDDNDFDDDELEELDGSCNGTFIVPRL